MTQQQKYFLFDCETGGLPEQNTTLLTLFGTVLDVNLNVLDEIDLSIRPVDDVYKVHPKALMINKIDLIEHYDNSISIDEAVNKIYDFCTRHTLNEKMIPAGHNIQFDINFVKQTLFKNHPKFGKNINWDAFFTHRHLDTASLAFFLQLCGKLPNDLNVCFEELLKYFEIPTENIHNAKIDVYRTIAVLKKMIELVD